MGAVKLLLKAIIIPVVLFFLAVAIIVWLVSRRRQRKQKQNDIENRGFQPPPITQWGTGPYQPSLSVPPVQKPEAAVYSTQAH